MRTNAAIKPLLERVFASRDVGELSHLLGFESARAHIASLTESISRSIGSPVRIYMRGARATLACYEIRADQPLDHSDLARVARALRCHNYAQLQLYIVVSEDFSAITIGTFGLGEHLLTLALRPERFHPADLEMLQEMIPANGERGSALVHRFARALDRTRVTQRFFSDFAAQRDRVAAAWTQIAPQAKRDREQLALLLLSRLMFLYFLQHRGYLAGDDSYLVRRFRAWTAGSTFYRGALCPLFFHVLNRRPELRPARARAFGDLPYLNGGLFERHALERKHSRIDVDNTTLQSVFDDLLERYRFTAREASEAHVDGVHDVGVDPEMLGRVFEQLMAARVRETTGTFYTPAATVDRLVCDTLVAHLEPRVGATAAASLVREANASSLDPYQRRTASTLLRETRILDPACGSGAFLLGGLARIAQARSALDNADLMAVRRDAVSRTLYGVDLQSDAALLCALRLWLALVPGGDRETVQPLPNLDRQIRQGDSLVDPLDLSGAAFNSAIRTCTNELQPAAHAYVTSEPEQRPAIRRTLVRAENRLARAWIDAHQQRITYETAELTALARQTDLFGAVTSEARAARLALRIAKQRAAELRKLSRDIHKKDERPFFSFGVHFSEASLPGFDIVLCNPPWVRSHNWPRTITDIVRERFDVCRSGAWRLPFDKEVTTAGGNQIDLALLFLERAVELLAPGGVLGIILPAKFMRSLSGAAARKLLLERTDIISIEDHSLDQRSIFAADAFAAAIVARKRAPDVPSSSNPIEISCIKRGATPMKYQLAQRDLSLFTGDSRAPWLLAPAAVRRALMRMYDAHPIGSHSGLNVRRGVVTGANDVMVLTRAEAKLADLSEIRSEGHSTAASPRDYEGVVESAAVKPLARGCDVSAWSFRHERFVLCRPAHATTSYPRLARYMSRHKRTISDVPKIGEPQTMLAWHDLANTLKAVVIPNGVVALNTVYFIPIEEDLAHVLCAYFNSLPVRTFARAIAERAKDAHFRFFAWTVSLLPLPTNWRLFEADRLREISRAAHAAGSIDESAQAELDDIVARVFELSRADVRALALFDEWLRPA